MNPFREAIAGALESVRQVAGADILYRRGDVVVSLRATVGVTSLKLTTGEGLELRQKWRDYIIDAAALVIGGLPTKPERFDEITDGTEVFTVANIPGGNLYEVEAQGLSYRIHATRTSAG